MLMATGHTYHPLDANEKEIRILVLQPIHVSEDDDDLVVADLAYISLEGEDGSPEEDYETVSYAWGDSTLRSTIRLDGEIVSIPQNSEQALRRFRHKASERILWIDAICINQEDPAERSQQVAIMADIYRKGIRNLIYLGEPDDTTAAAAQSIRLLCNTEIQSEMNRVKSLLQLFFDVDGDFQLSDWPLRTKIDEEALAKFYSRPWFSRLWVIQEAALSPKSTCYCGEYKIRLFSVLLVAQWLEYKSSFLERDIWEGIRGRHNAAEMFDYLPSIHSRIGSGEYRADIQGLLHIAKSASCSDPRDKVYAILGLLKWSGSPGIPPELMPDYSKDLKDVFTSAAAFAIDQNEEDLLSKFLESVSHRSESDLHIDGLPSWIPRWQRQSNRDLDSLPIYYQNGMPLFYEMGWLPRQAAEFNLETDSSIKYGRLIVEGYEVDEIRNVHPLTNEKFEWTNFVSDYLIPLQELFKDEKIDPMSSMSDMLTWRKWANLDSMNGEQAAECISFLNRLSILGPGQDWEDRHFEAETAIIGGCNRRVVGKTTDGRPALLPFITQKGDKVVQLLEVNTPTILRPCGKHFEVIGQAYVHGIMSCEPLKDLYNDGVELEVFSLI